MENTVSNYEYNMESNSESIELLKDMENRNFNLRSNHNTAYFTFIWFIISITSVFIWFKSDLNIYTTYIFLWTILSFVIWFYLYFEESVILIKKSGKMYNIVADALDKKTNPLDSLQKNIEKKCYEKFIWKAYVFFQNLWLILFMLWIVVYVVTR